MKPELNQSVWFTPYSATGVPQDRVRAKINKVWSDTCVNLECEDGNMPASVLFVQSGAEHPAGYYCEPVHSSGEKLAMLLGAAEFAPLLPHQARVVAEKDELGEKLMKLLCFFQTPTFANLPEAERSRLRNQARFMDGYAAVLEERIAAF